MASILTRTPLASYTFVDKSGKKNIRVVYQDKDGKIRQCFYKQGEGWHKRSNNLVGTADLNNGVAITGWDDGVQERIYYINDKSEIVERCYSGGAAGEWYDGELTGNKFTAAHYSQLAVTSFQYGDIFRIRVYYQDQNDKIQELVRDNANPWTTGASFPVAIKGTSIASTSLKAKPNYIWLWFQLPDTSIIEYLFQNSPWKKGIFQSKLQYDPGAYIAAASYGSDSHRVFTVTRQNQLAVTAFNGPANSWEPSKVIAEQIPFASLAAISVAGQGEPDAAVRIYGQEDASKITEWGTSDGKKYEITQPSLPLGEK
jgi:hypothetical protein